MASTLSLNRIPWLPDIQAQHFLFNVVRPVASFDKPPNRGTPLVFIVIRPVQVVPPSFHFYTRIPPRTAPSTQSRENVGK